jgi:hypothetical protein
MDSEQSNTWLSSVIKLYEVGNGEKAWKPKAIFSREAINSSEKANNPHLIIVSGKLHNPFALAQAVQTAGRQNEQALLIAVLRLEDDLHSTAKAERQEWHDAFDAVFVINDAINEQFIRRLVRTMTTPLDSEQLIGCDWNDVCHIVKKTTHHRQGFFGFGWSSGNRRSIEATAAALEQIASQGGHLHDASGFCIRITAAPTRLTGKEIKEVMRHLRAEINSTAHIVQCIGYDSTLIDGRMEVDVFAFTIEQTNSANKPSVASHEIKSILKSQFSDPDSLLYNRARSIVLSEQRASISLVQRHLHIGYQQASRLLDTMEGDILSVKNEHGIRTVVVAC